MAMGVYYAATDLGIRVPVELSILSGADTYLTQLAPVPITTIHIPHQKSGYRAAQLLMEVLAGKEETEKIIIPHQLTERDSCARIA